MATTSVLVGSFIGTVVGNINPAAGVATTAVFGSNGGTVSGADPEPWQWQTRKRKQPTTRSRKELKDDLREMLQEIIAGPAPTPVREEAEHLLERVDASPKATAAQVQVTQRLTISVQQFKRQRRRRQEEELLLLLED